MKKSSQPKQISEFRQLPQAPDAEKSLIAAAMHGAADQVCSQIQPESFYKTAHQLIFKAISELHRSKKTINLVPVVEKLRANNLLEEAGGASNVSRLYDFPAAMDIETTAGFVKEAELRRNLIADMTQLTRKAFGQPIDGLLQNAKETLSRLSESVDPKHKRAVFQLVHCTEIKIKKLDWIVKNLLEADSIGMVFGDPGSAKSFFALGLSACVATGTPFFGKTVKKGLVIYIAGEGQNGIYRRLAAWSIRNRVGVDEMSLFVSLMPAALCDSELTQVVIDQINCVASTHGSPVLVVIDTVARNFGPGDENSTQDMTAFIQAVDKIRAAHLSTILLVHHTGHADKTRARGAMALKGALDAEYRLDKDDQGIIRLECTKSKDFSPPEPMAFRLRTVELGISDEDGQPITSAVLNTTTYEPKAAAGTTGRGSNQTIGLEMVHSLLQRNRQNLINGGFSPGSARVKVEDWRNACVPDKMDRHAFSKIKRSLQKNGLIKIEHGFVEPA